MYQDMLVCDDKPLVWNREAIDLQGLTDRELLVELCRRVIDYHGTTMHFFDCERGTRDMLMENDNNYCRVREVVKHVTGVDLEYVSERVEEHQ